MKSVIPPPDEMKRLQKLMRRISVVEKQDIDSIPQSPRQQKKASKALRKIVNDSMSDDSPVRY